MSDRVIPMSFGQKPRGGRSVSVVVGPGRKNPERPWEQPPFERALLYVRQQAMEVK